MDPHTKDRIIAYMNRDRQLALVDYTVVYGKQPITAFRPSTVEISDISEEYIKLRFEQANGTIKAITIDWDKAEEADSVSVELASDIKPKLIAMTVYAAKKRGFSDKKIRKTIPPNTGISYFMYASAAVLTATLINPKLVSSLLAGTSLEKSRFFSIWLFIEKNIVKIFTATYGIHLAEVIFMMIPKIKYYRMPLKTGLAWAFFNYIEGFLAHIRLNKVAKAH